ncbi:hypothetical protein [Geobacter sulfurreducens]|uniref:hypothetical protein n=1 Tax=Geobacter sulfurreducens TaxID=35554 RepID=UPI0020B81BB8|nr:hypothetical protein [Geobacter sulfurreducens]
MISSVHNFVLTTATFIAAISMISCGADSADSTPSLPAQRPFYDFQYNLDQLTVGIRLFHPDYPYSPRIDIYEGATLCDLSTAIEN